MADKHIPPSTAPVTPGADSHVVQPPAAFNGAAHAPGDTLPPPVSPAAPNARPGLWRRLWSSTPRQTGKQPTAQADSVREVIETVVFVVVLVLLLKSFAAEAFVIPTGSMAETLWGYQKVVECPSCHIKFPVNCSSEVEYDPESRGLEPITGCTCPNCRQDIRFNSPNATRSYRSDILGEVAEVPDPGWNSGDRVLVGKFVYDLLDQAPNRLDVVVFKYPGDFSFPRKGPYQNNTPMNYIKRLIGLPGETILIHGGNIYILKPGKGPHYDDYEQARNDRDKFALLWQKEYMHVHRFDEDRLKSLHEQGNEDALKVWQLWKNGQFEILRKDPETMLAMMRLVYDNDHPGKGLPERWRGKAGGWQAAGDHGFRHDGSGSGTHWLRYWHLPNRNKADKPESRELITDFMGYNTFRSGKHGGPPEENWVNDLILECEATLPDKPTGELTLELSRGIDRFRARWDLSSPDGHCTLYRSTRGGPEKKLAEASTSLRGKGTYKLRLANVDERLTVWVDGRLPFDAGVPYPPAETEGADPANDLEPASVGLGKGAAVQVDKLRLMRDTYYTASDASPNKGDAPPDVKFSDPHSWGPLGKLPVLTMYVQPGHYLCLGDNSPESSDGRSWGTVPQRLLLGRAVLVYYPFSRAGRIR
jgi:signal peptidase I